MESQIKDRILGLVYGNCIGDAIGLLTEFMSKREAKLYYGKHRQLKYEHKVPDMHRERWETGDWTDDSDQMILILLSLVENDGKVVVTDFASRLVGWMNHGFPELGDKGGMGIGKNTHTVLMNRNYLTTPLEVSERIWNYAGEHRGQYPAPNGAVMRTAILGAHHYRNMDEVIQNTRDVCKTTHFDQRCQASCVCVTTAIAMMLQRQPKHLKSNGKYKVDVIIEDCYTYSKDLLPTDEMRTELEKVLKVTKLKELDLEEAGKIGYTYKTLGAGFWAFKQKDFREAIQKITMQAGDADTNAAVAGALLGCKLGVAKLPDKWLHGLKHKAWLDDKIDKFIRMQEATS